MQSDTLLKRERRILRPLECRDLIGIMLDRYASSFHVDWSTDFGDLFLAGSDKPERREQLYLFPEDDPYFVGISNLICAEFYRASIREMFIVRHSTGDSVGLTKEFTYHATQNGEKQRKMFFSIPLNSSYEGGILNVNGESATQQIGVATFFDVKSEYEITPVTAGNRFSLIGYVYK